MTLTGSICDFFYTSVIIYMAFPTRCLIDGQA